MDQNQNPPPNPPQSSPKQQIVEALKGATNVLVTVNRSPNVDQLAACIGLTLMLNKLDKHATAVFSGAVPSTIEFLQPEKTLEQNTDSLRDFIISLDRAKADKLRYKVEDDVVKIFITPYRTSLSEADLQYSQGDFNVDVVIALGVDQREHLDKAIAAHGRILHDATVVSLSVGNTPSDVGSVNWHEAGASSLCEMLVSISESFQSGLLDGQMATSFLTGIVSETDRFRNDKTSPKVMTMSAQLMAAGANQQLIATQLDQRPEVPEPPLAETMPAASAGQDNQPAPDSVAFDVPQEGEEGTNDSSVISLQTEAELPAPEDPGMTKLDSPAPAVDMAPDAQDPSINRIHIDDKGYVHDAAQVPSKEAPEVPVEASSAELAEVIRSELSSETADDGQGGKYAHKIIQPLDKEDQPAKTDLSKYIFEPPEHGGTFTGSTKDDASQEVNNATIVEPQPDTPILSHESGLAATTTPPPLEPPASSSPMIDPGLPVIDVPAPITDSGSSPAQPPEPPQPLPTVVLPDVPLAPPVPVSDDAASTPATPPQSSPADEESARQAVFDAIAASNVPPAPHPIDALNAQPINLDAPLPVSDTAIPAPPPMPPPMMPVVDGSSPDNSALPPPSSPAQSNNPFNLPPLPQ